MKVFSPELERVLEEADAELGARTERNQRWGIADYPDWLRDQDTGLLSFVNEDGSGIAAPAQVAGTWRLADSSWLWSWANPSLDEALTVAARQTLSAIESRGLHEITEPRLDGLSEDQAWQLTALTGVSWDATGSYRGPAGDFHVFLVYGPLAEIAT